MERTPSDATRFTATGPYASNGSSFTPNSAPTPTGTQISFGTPVPENETPQQKIARLREAAAASRRIPETRFERVVRIGRGVADRAHRFTALGLVGMTVIAAMLATAGVTDMLLHNRRRRNEWLAEQHAKTKRDLKDAFAARDRGLATDDQMLLINRERAAAEAAEARKNRPGIFTRARRWVFGGGPTEPAPGATATMADASVVQHAIGTGAKEVESRGSVLAAAEDALARERRRGERMQELARPTGGPLDREAQRAFESVQNLSASWTSWMVGRK